MIIGDLRRRTSLRGVRKILNEAVSDLQETGAAAMVTRVNDNGCLAITSRIAFLVYGFEALKGRIVDAPYLRRRRLGRVAARGQRDVCGRDGSHDDGSVDAEELGDERRYDMSCVRTLAR